MDGCQTHTKQTAGGKTRGGGARKISNLDGPFGRLWHGGRHARRPRLRELEEGDDARMVLCGHVGWCMMVIENMQRSAVPLGGGGGGGDGSWFVHSFKLTD